MLKRFDLYPESCGTLNVKERIVIFFSRKERVEILEGKRARIILGTETVVLEEGDY